MYSLSPSIWREPKQTRSRKRVDAILCAAIEILVEQGYEHLQIRELAQRANVSVGTVYQFFDDREAIVAYLAAKYLAWQDEEITRRFADIKSITAWLEAISGAINVYYLRNLKQPEYSVIWRVAHSSRALTTLDQASTERHSQLLLNMLRPLLNNKVSDKELRMVCRMVCELSAHTIQIALTLSKDDAKTYIQQFERMIRVLLEDISKN